MKRLSDDELFEILDGAATEELKQRHQHWMITDASYEEYFAELTQMHLDLSALPLESPSLAFENKLMHQWNRVQAHRKSPILLKWLPFIFTGLMLALTLIGLLIMQDIPVSNPNVVQLQGLMKGFDFSAIQQLLLPVNAILLLLVIERIARKYVRHKLSH